MVTGLGAWVEVLGFCCVLGWFLGVFCGLCIEVLGDSGFNLVS